MPKPESPKATSENARHSEPGEGSSKEHYQVVGIPGTHSRGMVRAWRLRADAPMQAALMAVQTTISRIFHAFRVMLMS
jgi:hypothetical protein